MPAHRCPACHLLRLDGLEICPSHVGYAWGNTAAAAEDARIVCDFFHRKKVRDTPEWQRNSPLRWEAENWA